ncbi:MAG: molybdopterin converting factor subunit 1 [Dehalococcoidia bacterium]|nr:molybdopterin converting factor subunit 1 [Dehalococcoidia bacterium]
MQVQVRLFAIARERAGTSQAMLDVPAHSDVAQALSMLGSTYPKLSPLLARCMVAVNREYAQRDHTLHDNDELAIIPPVSGGAQ